MEGNPTIHVLELSLLCACTCECSPAQPNSESMQCPSYFARTFLSQGAVKREIDRAYGLINIKDILCLNNPIFEEVCEYIVRVRVG